MEPLDATGPTQVEVLPVPPRESSSPGRASRVMPSEVGGSSPSSPTSGPVRLRQPSGGSNDPADEGAIPSRTAKLYCVVRGDLKPGLRAAQAGHALIYWALAFGRPPDNLVILEVGDLRELIDLSYDVAKAGFRFSLFQEPDVDNEPTAIAVGPEGYRLLSSLPLAFRQS